MVRDFPVFGVGLGAWPELFPRYQRPPWQLTFYREAHNDFLEMLAEVGVVGTLLLGWFFWRVGLHLYRSGTLVSSRPLGIAFLVSAGTMAVHASFNFTLQVPANALLFTTLLALAVRMGKDQTNFPPLPAQSPLVSRAMAPAIGVLASVLLLAALKQHAVPYPVFASSPTSLAEARQLVLAYPARAASHHALFHLLGPAAPVDQRRRELEIALGLEPLNPTLRDQYAAILWQTGSEEAALQEISRSVFWSPLAATHAYIENTYTHWLSLVEQRAIETGFLQAVQAEYENAAVGLSTFYAAVGRTADEAAVYEKIAVTQTGPNMKAGFLLRATGAYLRGNDLKKAEATLRQVITLTPDDLRPYQHLVLRVFAPQEKLAQAKEVITEGLNNGIDPYALSMILAEAAQLTGDRNEQQVALQQATSLRPRSFDAYLQLGLFYLQGQKFDRAALALRHAADIDPQHAWAVYHLGVAEEGRYQFFAAEKAYVRAIELDQSNAEFRRRYEQLRAKTTKTQQAS